VGTGGTELDEHPSEIVFGQLQPAIISSISSSKSLNDLVQDMVVSPSQYGDGVSITTPKNNFIVDAVHIKSDRSYGFAVITPGNPPNFIKVMEGDPVKQEKKKDKKKSKGDTPSAEPSRGAEEPPSAESSGGTKRKRKRTKRKRTKRTKRK
jgi:hypothetical protein